MNKNVVTAIAGRDLRSWFSNPTGYIFIGLFVLLACVALMWSPAFFANNLANMETLNSFFPLLMILFVPALTMGMWTSERFNGTQELLFTLPARDADVLLGKMLAGIGVYTMSLLFTLPLPIALTYLGSPDWGQVFANYVGYWLLGVMLIPVAMLGSQLSQNQAVAFILGALFVCIIEYGGWLFALVTGGETWNQNGPLGQFAEFSRGMLPVSGLLLFVGFLIAFFQLNLACLMRRHWRKGDEGLHSGVRFLSLGIGAVALTVLGVHLLPRVDATFERVHSLGEESRKLVASLDPARPVTVTAYVSEEVQEEFLAQKRALLSLLDQFQSIGGGKVAARIEFVTPFSPESRTAEKEYGIVPVQARINGLETQMQLGFVVQCGTEEIVVPLVEPAVPLEYDLTRSIRVVAKAERKRIGLLRTDVEMGGGFDMQTYQPKKRWQIFEELSKQYKVENLDPDKDYDADEPKDDGAEPVKKPSKKGPLGCLVVPQPSSLTQEQMDRLKNWILAGNPTLLLEDPLAWSAPGSAIDDPKGGTRSSFNGGGGAGQKGDFSALLANLALHMPRAEVVWDTSSRSWFDGRIPYRHFLFAGGAGVDQGSPITKGLQAVVFMTSGHLEEQRKDGFTVTPLVSSLGSSSSDVTNGTMPKYESGQGSRDGVLVWDPFGSLQPNPSPQYHIMNRMLNMAVRVSSKPADGKTNGVNLICIGDLDVVGDEMFNLRRQNPDPNLRFDNVPFVLNCIDSLCGDDSLIELRKRRPVLRKLTRVENSQVAFEAAWAKERDAAEKEATASLRKAQVRLDEAVKKIKEAKDLDDQAKEVQIAQVEKVENRRLDLDKSRIDSDKNSRIEMAAHVRDLARRSIHTVYRSATLALAVLPALAVGILVFFRRRSREAAIVPAGRLVKGGGQ
ncbi:MAG: hypothetical protein EXS02_14505 [Planctomycetes bacterium]|nr:hypothetical protein [Planctomycetota bacterium]